MFTFLISIPFTSKEVEIKSAREADHSQENNDEEKLKMVVKRMANALWVEADKAMERNLQCAVGLRDSD